MSPETEYKITTDQTRFDVGPIHELLADIEALMLTYADDAQQFKYSSKLLASGSGQIRKRVFARFEEPNLHARLTRRIALGEVVIDHEEITRTFPEGTGTMALVAIYEVRNGQITTARFISGEKRLDEIT